MVRSSGLLLCRLLQHQGSGSKLWRISRILLVWAVIFLLIWNHITDWHRADILPRVCRTRHRTAIRSRPFTVPTHSRQHLHRCGPLHALPLKHVLPDIRQPSWMHGYWQQLPLYPIAIAYQYLLQEASCPSNWTSFQRRRCGRDHLSHCVPASRATDGLRMGYQSNRVHNARHVEFGRSDHGMEEDT